MRLTLLFAVILPLSVAAGSGNPASSPPTDKSAKLSVGSIEGRVMFVGTPPARQKLQVVKDRDICGKIEHYDQRLVVDKQGGMQNAVVWLNKVRGGKKPSSMGDTFILDQKGCAYLPHVLLLPVNQSLTILNSDGLLHNIHTFSRKNPQLNIAHTKFQKELKIKFTFPERVPVKCDVHGWMSAWIVVVDHPYYAVTDEKGRFALKDVPPGTYTVNCWNELLGEQSLSVTVSAESVAKVDFSFREQIK